MTRGALVLVALLGGCGGIAGHVADVAARQHDCPRDRVRVESSAGHWTYWVSVCGRRRLYSAADSRVEDITSTVSSDGRVTAGTPLPPRPTPPTWSGHEVDEFRDVTVAGVMACFPADRAAVRVRATVSSRGAVTYSRVVSAATASEQACVRDYLAGATGAAVADRSRTADIEYTRAAIPAPRATPSAATPAAADPVRAAVDGRRAAVLACVGGATVVCELTVAGDGSISVALRGDLAGTPEEGCVRAALAGIYAPAPATPGVVLHPVSP